MRINCAEYEESTGHCRLKKSALEGGPLTQLLERISQDTLNTRSPVCVLQTT